MEKFNNLLKESINLSNIDVLNKIFEYEQIWRKLLWLLILLILTGLTCWLLLLNCISYFDYDVISKIEILNERPSNFPVVTICDNNPFTTLYAQGLLNFFNIINLNSNISYNEAYVGINYAFNDAKIHAKANYDENVQKKLGFPFESIHSCYFNSRPCNMSNDFEWIYSYEHGNCWQFNSQSEKQTYFEGEENGLKMEIWPLVNSNKYPVVFSTGLVLFVHNRSTSAVPPLSERIYIRPGKKSRIGVERIFSSNQPKPYSDCTQDFNDFNTDIYRFILNRSSFAVYRRVDCLDLCRQKIIIQNCGCYFAKYDKLYSSLVPCLNVSQRECLSLYDSNFTIENWNKCLRECPLECDSVKYRVKVSSLIYPSQQEYLSNPFMTNKMNATYKEFKQISYAINVFYSSMQYTKITQTPRMLLFDLFSLIGGALGVFMGMSVFHLIELAEICASLLGNFVYTRKKLNKIETNTIEKEKYAPIHA
jgi:hypothetical protein